MRFDGRVAIVTGAGGNPGLGRSHAMLLAERGAKVVVNDLGVGSDGRGEIPTSAEAVAQEIVDAGGEAVADTHSVAVEESAHAIVQTALDSWGRIDILINNANVGVVARFDEITSSHLQTVIGVHLLGTIWMCRAAWPHMKDQGYGRIVNTTSDGMWGFRGINIYGAAKFGIFGITRGLAIEGLPDNIRVNAVSPGAYTQSFDPYYSVSDPKVLQAFKDYARPELVSPVYAYLAHEDSEITGALLDATGGKVVARMYGLNEGYSNAKLNIEDVRDNLDTIFDASTLRLISDPLDPDTGASDLASLMQPKPYRPL
jgi:NAD(P)-dependent dehydrogenase (short-subunit alcohol dehydrogenase family)